MLSRLFLARASVVASLGLLFYGMGSSYSPKWNRLEDAGLIMLIGGGAATLLGVAWYRQTEKNIEADMVREYGPNRHN
jgi:hypothetical protein